MKVYKKLKEGVKKDNECDHYRKTHGNVGCSEKLY